MSVVVVGLEKHQTPLDLLERVSIPEGVLSKALSTLRDRSNLAEVVVVSTCLRTEIYAVVDRFHEAVEDLEGFLADLAGTSPEEVAEHATVLFDDAVAVHLFEVAAGLRSAVLGETEVLGQVRRAMERAEAERASGPVLSGLFKAAVKAGRLVRSATAISQGSTSMSHVAVELAAERAGGSLDGRNVLVIGAGEVSEGIVDVLAKRHSGADVVVANRTTARAKELAKAVEGKGIGLNKLADAVRDADVVLVSTASALPLVDRQLLGRSRSGRPLLIVDLGVPRNVDPSLRSLEGVELLDIDSLSEHAASSLNNRRAEVESAEDLVRSEVERFRADGRARGVAPVVSALRSRVEELRLSELERHRPRLAELGEEQWREVDAVVKDVLAKVLHSPTVVLKDAAGTPRGERLVEALRALFDL